MSLLSVPDGRDYDESLLANAPSATRAEKQVRRATLNWQPNSLMCGDV